MELLLRTIAIESATFALVWFGYVEGLEGAKNVFSAFLFFVLVPVSCFLLTESMAKKMAQDGPHPYTKARRYIISLGLFLCAVVLAWVWQPFHVVAILFVWFCEGVMWQAVDKIRNDAKAVDATTKQPHNAT